MVTQDEQGKLNMFSKEPQVEVLDPQEQLQAAELLNGRLAMIGIIAGMGAILTTGQIIPGII